MKLLARVVLAAALALTTASTLGPAAAAGGAHTAHLSASNEVPTNESRAQGQFVSWLSADGTELRYRLVFANLENPVAAHIHVAPEGVNGPVVAFLHGPAAPGGGVTSGVVATGTITADDLLGPLAGQPLSALVAAIEAGGTYVNAHTSDGDPTTTGGPGDIAGGEIRGQIR